MVKSSFSVPISYGAPAAGPDARSRVSRIDMSAIDAA